MSTQLRQQKGQPTGGQFAGLDRPEAEVSLVQARFQSSPEPTSSPWGEIDQATELAPGIWTVSTPSHGGVKLSAERNALVPAPYRVRGGWYEEDCEWQAAARTFPEAFVRSHNSVEDVIADAEDSLKRWSPLEWEKVNGRELAPGESVRKDEIVWSEAHRQDLVVRSAITAESNPDMVVVTASRGSDGERGEFLVPREEYRAAERGQFVVDPSRHPALPPKAAPVGERKATGVQVDASAVSAVALSEAAASRTLTPAARDRIAKDLSQPWRRADGSIETTRDVITGSPVTVTAYADGATTRYAVIQPGPKGEKFSLRVSRDTFRHLQLLGVPDDRTPAQIASQEASVAEEKAEKLRARFVSGSSSRWQKQVAEAADAQNAATALREKAAELFAAERAAYDAEHGSPAERDARRKAEQAARERAATITV